MLEGGLGVRGVLEGGLGGERGVRGWVRVCWWMG